MNQFRTGQKPTAKKLDALLTSARASLPWLREGSSVVQQQTIRDYATALSASFSVKGRGRPVLKTRKKNPYVSLNYTTRGFSIKDSRLKLAGGVSMPVVWSRDLPSTPTSVRVYEDAAGWWWASFMVEVPDSEPLPDNPRSIGIDWGVRTTASTTDPDYDLDYQGHARRQAKSLAKIQRRMALHYKKGEAEQNQAYRRAKKKAARVHRRVRWQRQETARKWAQKVTRAHGNIAIENFKPKFLASSSMARKAHDAAIGALKKELLYQAGETGRTAVLVSTAYTTMTCSSCGARAKHRLPLTQRTFRCDACGFADDRDRNAARVILYQAGFNLAPNDGVSPEPVSAGSAS